MYEIGEHEGRAFIAMEYVEGESLRVSVSSGQLSVNSAIDIATQICDGLNAAHEVGIIHRDTKPENIIVDKTGRVRILDFGLAKTADKSMLTKEGTTLGTISYMSPEQFQGVPVDHRADIWAVGVVLYEMLAGELPFKGEYESNDCRRISHCSCHFGCVLFFLCSNPAYRSGMANQAIDGIGYL
ncbi:MAG: serine/threonine-protein kinase [bacterium]